MVCSAAISEIIVKGKLRQILITMTETTAHFVSLFGWRWLERHVAGLFGQWCDTHGVLPSFERYFLQVRLPP